MEPAKQTVIRQQVVYIPTEDLSRAQAFYANVFGFDPSLYHTVADPGGDQWAIFPMYLPNEAGKAIPTGFYFLGLGHSPHLIPSDKGTLPFLPCDDMDQTLEKVRIHGGRVLQNTTLERQTKSGDHQPIAIYHAFSLDTEGNKIGLTHARLTTDQTTSNP